MRAEQCTAFRATLAKRDAPGRVRAFWQDTSAARRETAEYGESDPVRELHNIAYPVETPVARMVVKHGIVRLAYRDPEEAMIQWHLLKGKYQFFGEDDNYVMRHIGILAAQDQLPQALVWLSEVSADPADETLHLWRVKTALRAGQWETAKLFIAGLSEEQQRNSQWRYWSARILEATGSKSEARSLYQGLARDRSYYGFLAADRLGEDYSMQHVSIEASPEEISAMLARPGIQMAQELYQMGQVTDARRQWIWTMRRMNNRDLAVAAVIAAGARSSGHPGRRRHASSREPGRTFPLLRASGRLLACRRRRAAACAARAAGLHGARERARAGRTHRLPGASGALRAQG